MRKAALIFIFSALCLGAESPKTTVYLCMGKGSKKYHFDAHCRGLSNCSTPIYKASLSEAKNLGRTLCGWED